MVKVKEQVRVRDLLLCGDLAQRRVVGSIVSNRVGSRWWNRPNVAISNRLYRKYGLDDPWDPDRSDKPRELGLGPVGLRLTEPRRQVAPHLKPKQPKKKPKPQAADPLARWRKKPPTKSAAPAPAPPQEPKPEPPSPFGAKPQHRLKGKLPVRPDFEVAHAAVGTSTSKLEDIAPQSTGSSEQEGGLEPRSSSRRRASSSARFRMRGQHIKSEPPKITGRPARVVETAKPPLPVTTKPEIDRGPPKTGMGMNDVFSSIGDAGRMRVRRDHSKTGPTEGESE